MAHDTDDYIAVHGVVREIRKGSVLFAVGESVPRAAWIPRSVVHAADDLALNGMFAGQPMTLRIRCWKAEDVGFSGGQDSATGNLFDQDGVP